MALQSPSKHPIHTHKHISDKLANVGGVEGSPLGLHPAPCPPFAIQGSLERLAWKWYFVFGKQPPLVTNINAHSWCQADESSRWGKAVEWSHVEQILSPDTWSQDIAFSVLSFNVAYLRGICLLSLIFLCGVKLQEAIFPNKRLPWWARRDNTLSPFPRIKTISNQKILNSKSLSECGQALSSGALLCVVSSVKQILKVICNPFLLPFSPLESGKAKFSMSQSLTDGAWVVCGGVGWGWISKEIRWISQQGCAFQNKRQYPSEESTFFFFSWDLDTLPVEIKLQQLEEQQLICDHKVESMERRSSELRWRKKI